MAKKGKVEVEEETGPSKKELRAAKKEQKKAAMKALQATKSDQDRMLSHINIRPEADAVEDAPSA